MNNLIEFQKSKKNKIRHISKLIKELLVEEHTNYILMTKGGTWLPFTDWIEK